jgi:hypothetical protein
MSDRVEPKFIVQEVREGWHSPGYRDPELHLMTDKGELHVRLTPQAFVELHNILCAQQGCIDRNKHLPIDWARYPYNTTDKSVRRDWREKLEPA